jgi:hypothetical protein
MEASMRKAFLTTLGAAAIGFLHPTAGWSQSAVVAPATVKSNVSPISKAGYDAMARVKKSGIKRGLSVDGVKRDDSWYRQTPDPCQVEG